MNPIITGVILSLVTATLNVLVVKGIVEKKIEKVEHSNKKRRENIQKQFKLDRKITNVLFTVLKRINYGIKQYQATNNVFYWDVEYQKAIDELYEVEQELKDFDTEILSEMQGERGN